MVDKRLGGDIAGPGGPHDRGKVLFSTEGALIPDYVMVAVLDDTGPELVIGLLLEGRINQTTDRAKVLVLMGEDGHAGLISELIALYGRAGRTTSPTLDPLIERLTKLRDEGLERAVPE